MKYSKETLNSTSLSEFRILCKLDAGNFACFNIQDPDNLIHELADIEKTLQNKGIQPDCAL